MCGKRSGQMPTGRSGTVIPPGRGPPRSPDAIVLAATLTQPQHCSNHAAADSRPGKPARQRTQNDHSGSRCLPFRPVRPSARSADTCALGAGQRQSLSVIRSRARSAPVAESVRVVASAFVRAATRRMPGSGFCRSGRIRRCGRRAVTPAHQERFRSHTAAWEQCDRNPNGADQLCPTWPAGRNEVE
jgi:hypothetical protein